MVVVSNHSLSRISVADWEFAYDLAKVNSGAAQLRQKKSYDRKPSTNKIEIGDRSKKKQNVIPCRKLDNYWENNVYIVRAKPNAEVPAYVEQREDGLGQCKTLRQNHLKPCPFVPNPPDQYDQVSQGHESMGTKGRTQDRALLDQLSPKPLRHSN